MKRTMLMAIVVSLVWSCEREPTPAVPDTPPDWVREAQQRSRENAEPEPVPEPEVKLVVDEPLLWSISAKSGAQSHILGTYHVGTDFQNLPALPTSVRTAFEDCTTVVLEADTGASPDEDLSKFVVATKPLRSQMKPESWDILLEETGLPPQKLDRLQPHVVMSTLLEKWTPDAGIRGMDGRFIILARAHDKPMVFLETAAQQLEMLSQHVTMKMVLEMVDDIDAQKQKLDSLRAAFRAGDATTLEQITFDPAQVDGNKQFYEALFFERNARWVAPLKPLLDQGGAFVAVGAGHLVGSRSLIAELEAAGYVVARVGRKAIDTAVSPTK